MIRNLVKKGVKWIKMIPNLGIILILSDNSNTVVFLCFFNIFLI
jgi:hypothetical protein